MIFILTTLLFNQVDLLDAARARYTDRHSETIDTLRIAKDTTQYPYTDTIHGTVFYYTSDTICISWEIENQSGEYLPYWIDTIPWVSIRSDWCDSAQSVTRVPILNGAGLWMGPDIFITDSVEVWLDIVYVYGHVLTDYGQYRTVRRYTLNPTEGR